MEENLTVAAWDPSEHTGPPGSPPPRVQLTGSRVQSR